MTLMFNAQGIKMRKATITAACDGIQAKIGELTIIRNCPYFAVRQTAVHRASGRPSPKSIPLRHF